MLLTTVKPNLTLLLPGLAVGDSIAPFFGGVLFDTLGICAANGSQTIASVPAILLMWATLVLHSSRQLTVLPAYVLDVTQPPSLTKAAAGVPTSKDSVHCSVEVLLDCHGKGERHAVLKLQHLSTVLTMTAMPRQDTPCSTLTWPV